MRVMNYGELPPPIKLYSCYSPKQKDYLLANGVEYIYSCRNNKTGKIKWIFVECERLSALLTLWTKNKPKGGDSNGEENW